MQSQVDRVLASSYQSITSGSRLSRDLVRRGDQVYLDSVSTMTSTLATLLVCACIVTFVSASLEDGFPRPANFADEPTTSYGPDPVLTDSGISVSCDWYGFSNTLYANEITSTCQTILRRALTNSTANPASVLKPYVYYTLMRLIDPATNESYCYQGCFKLDFATPPVSAPPPSYVRGPALAPMLEPVMAPIYFDGPAVAPVGESPYESPYGAPAMSPGN